MDRCFFCREVVAKAFVIVEATRLVQSQLLMHEIFDSIWEWFLLEGLDVFVLRVQPPIAPLREIQLQQICTKVDRVWLLLLDLVFQTVDSFAHVDIHRENAPDSSHHAEQLHHRGALTAIHPTIQQLA
jgi:hypothetical protein